MANKWVAKKLAGCLGQTDKQLFRYADRPAYFNRPGLSFL